MDIPRLLIALWVSWCIVETLHRRYQEYRVRAFLSNFQLQHREIVAKWMGQMYADIHLGRDKGWGYYSQAASKEVHETTMRNKKGGKK